MKTISHIEFHTGSKEERLPGFAPEFPYIASRVELSPFMGHFVPWHWHKSVELFYMESGMLEYETPRGKLIFPAGSGGLVNSNVLHMTRPQAGSGENIQLLHLFDPMLIAGEQGGRIEQKYVTPIVTAPQIEILGLYPGDPEQAGILDAIRRSFSLSEHGFGYEIELREVLSGIWVRLLAMARPMLEEKEDHGRTNDKIKSMMAYVHEHYAEKISVAKLAAAGFSSQRECFRAFRDCLHMTPVDYMRSYRLQMACRLLAEGRESITAISHACGLGSSSYFGKVFREDLGCTPLEYRRKWRDNDR